MNLLRAKELSSWRLEVLESNGKCKYHPKVRQSIRLDKAIPPGICPYLYAAAYPYALSLLYDAEFSWRKKIDKDSVIAQCLMPGGQMIFKVKRIKNPRINKELLKKFEEERYKIIIELLEKRGKTRDCSDCLGYKKMVVGSTFEFNRGDLPGVCPAVFNQIIPHLEAVIRDKKGKQRVAFSCPDPKTNVIFELRRI